MFRIPLRRSASLFSLFLAVTLALVLLPGSPGFAAVSEIEITQQPQATTGIENMPFPVVAVSVQATAGAGDAPTVTYQWQRLESGAWNDVSGQTAKNLTFSPTTIDLSGSYRVVITASDPSDATYRQILTSDPAVVTIKPARPNASATALLKAYFEGELITSTISVEGNPVFTVSWEVSNNGWMTVSSVGSGATLSLPAALSLNGFELRAVVTSEDHPDKAFLPLGQLAVLASTPPAPLDSDFPGVEKNNLLSSVEVVGNQVVATIAADKQRFISVGDLFHAYAFSTPTPLGWARVGADHTLRWDIASLAPGVHTLAVQYPMGPRIFLSGLGTFSVAAAPAPGGAALANTGPATPLPLFFAATVLLGCGVLLRRQSLCD